jgi:hypothetical protein
MMGSHLLGPAYQRDFFSGLVDLPFSQMIKLIKL